MFIQHHGRFRQLGFDVRPVSSSLGPVFLVFRRPPKNRTDGGAKPTG